MDISWIIEQERLENIQKKCIRESFSTIEFVCIYINQEMEIETMEKETMEINDTKIIHSDLLREWSIQKKKYTPKSIFELKETLWFHIDIEPEQIQTIDTQSSIFLKAYKPLEEIKLTPSIFIFHSLSTLFFIYQEELNKPNQIIERKPKIDKKKRTLRIVLPSSSSSSNNRLTRRAYKETVKT